MMATKKRTKIKAPMMNAMTTVIKTKEIKAETMTNPSKRRRRARKMNRKRKEKLATMNTRRSSPRAQCS